MQYLQTDGKTQRKVQTSSVKLAELRPAKHDTSKELEGLPGLSSQLHTLLTIPGSVEFGTLHEGYTYSHQLVLRNKGFTPCRYRVKLPPAESGLSVIYTPGPVRAQRSHQKQCCWPAGQSNKSFQGPITLCSVMGL